jgi:AcrR family transcriptional regulator
MIRDFTQVVRNLLHGTLYPGFSFEARIRWQRTPWPFAERPRRPAPFRSPQDGVVGGAVATLAVAEKTQSSLSRRKLIAPSGQLASRGLSAINIQLATGPNKKLAVIQNNRWAPGEFFESSSDALQDAGEVFSITASKRSASPMKGLHWGCQWNGRHHVKCKRMVEIKVTQGPGRPRVRPDGETRQAIYEAAHYEFTGSGYAGTSMETVAYRAGVSTKTLYRLFPNKAALFEGTMSDRLDRLLSDVNLDTADHADIEETLCGALITCTNLALDAELVALQRMVLQEAGKFPDIAGTFYANAIERTVMALAGWLRVQQTRGLIALDDVEEAAGMLLGMVASAPRRAAIFGRLPLPSRSQIEARVRTCAALFLRGCQVQGFRGY